MIRVLAVIDLRWRDALLYPTTSAAITALTQYLVRA